MLWQRTKCKVYAIMRNLRNVFSSLWNCGGTDLTMAYFCISSGDTNVGNQTVLEPIDSIRHFSKYHFSRHFSKYLLLMFHRRKYFFICGCSISWVSLNRLCFVQCYEALTRPDVSGTCASSPTVRRWCWPPPRTLWSSSQGCAAGTPGVCHAHE